MGSAGDFTRRIAASAAEKAFRNYLNQKNFTTPPLNGAVGCLNDDRTKVKFENGQEFPVVVIGNPPRCCFVQQIEPGKYLAMGPKPQFINIGGGKPIGYFLYGGTEGFYVRKATERTFYSYEPPVVAGLSTAPHIAQSFAIDNDMRLSSGFFFNRASWFNYGLRIGRYNEEITGLQPGSISINFAFVNPTFKSQDGNNTIDYTVSSQGSYLFNGGRVGAAGVGDDNTFVFTAGYEEEVSGATDSPYEWVTNNVVTYVIDTDLGSVSLYNEIYSNKKIGPSPITDETQTQQGCMVLTYNTETGTKIDFGTEYIQANVPFSGKIISSEVTTFTGAFTTIFEEEFGPDEDNLTTVQTPMTGNWEAVTTVDYAYGTSDTTTGIRPLTITTTYAITIAELIEYTPVGVGQVIDRLLSGGPLGAIDLVTNPSPPFGYLKLYAHPPVDVASVTSGNVTTTALFNLTDPLDPAFLVPLSTVEDTEEHLADLPFQNSVIEVTSTQGFYFSGSDLSSRVQRKFISVTDIMGTDLLTQTIYSDSKTWNTEAETINSFSDDPFFSYDNVSFGGYSVYNETESVHTEFNGQSWDTDSHFEVVNNFFSYFGTFLGPAPAINMFKTNKNNGLVFFRGLDETHGIPFSNIQNKATYDLFSNELIKPPHTFPYIYFHPYNSQLDQVVDQVATFNFENPASGNFRVFTDENKVLTFSWRPLIGTVTEMLLTNWSYDSSNDAWIKGNEITETYTPENPLILPAGITDSFNVLEFSVF